MTTPEYPERGHRPRPNVIEVQMTEWRAGPPESILITDGLGPCTGIAIHDQATHQGYVGHFVLPHVERPSVEGMFRSAMGDGTPDPARFKVWVRGSAIDELGEFEDEGTADDTGEVTDNDPRYDPVAYQNASRAYVMSLLESFGIVDADVRWSESGESVGMELDCAAGTCTTYTVDIREHLRQRGLAEGEE